MFKYLIADYILGYSLSTDYPFSPDEIGKELHIPIESVTSIMTDLRNLKSHWFEINRGSSRNQFTMARKNQYDEEIILWLTKGNSRNHYKLAEFHLKGEKPTPAMIIKKKLLFTLAVFSALIKFCLIIMIRQYKKNKDVLSKYITALKTRMAKTAKFK